MLDYAIIPLGFALLYVLWDLGRRRIEAMKYNALVVDNLRACERAIEQIEKTQQQIKERMNLALGSRVTQLPRRGAS